MKLIISEKAIAGENISNFLADGSVSTKIIGGAKIFEFNWRGVETILVPLRGHISDVAFPKKFVNWRGVDVRKLLDPKELIYTEKEFSIINALRSVASEVNSIIIATDADREGESIGLEALNYALSVNPKLEIKRAYFSAITKTDINTSFDSLSEFDYNFAFSANARREIDLIWGAVLTRFVSIVSGQLGKDFLSVGRVQTPTLALIVNREKERISFVKKPFWELVLRCEKNFIKFDALHSKEKFWVKEEAQKIFDSKPTQAIVNQLEKKIRIIKKPVPFNTTEFLRAATAIGFSAGKAMSIAESLYQRGFSSYPRTDNSVYPPSLDLKGVLNKLASVKEFRDDVNSVLSQKEILPSRGRETKDHPPIYPVLGVAKERLTQDDWRIYELISRRFLATLSEDARTENTSVLLSASNEPFVAKGQVILFEGWKKIYPYSVLNENVLPQLKVGDVVKVNSLDLLSKETQPPNRFSQGSLLKLMEDNNLGTKSTRPAIIQKLFSRKYILGNKSVEPTKIAFALIDSLEKNCEIVTQPKMTSVIEKEMDEVAAGKKKQFDVVLKSSSELGRVMDTLFEKKDVIGLELRLALKSNSTMGVCPTCKSNLVERRGRTGKRFVGCSAYPNCTVTFPLPQKGVITPLDSLCVDCSAPMISVKNKRFSYKMCLNFGCVSKKDWGKKTVSAPTTTSSSTNSTLSKPTKSNSTKSTTSKSTSTLTKSTTTKSTKPKSTITKPTTSKSNSIKTKSTMVKSTPINSTTSKSTLTKPITAKSIMVKPTNSKSTSTKSTASNSTSFKPVSSKSPSLNSTTSSTSFSFEIVTPKSSTSLRTIKKK